MNMMFQIQLATTHTLCVCVCVCVCVQYLAGGQRLRNEQGPRV